MANRNRKTTAWVFIVMIVIMVAIFARSVIKVDIYNKTKHNRVFSGAQMFEPTKNSADSVSVSVAPRSSTWSKAFDFNNEGITEHNYQAYTYDFTVSNNTQDDISSFTFKLTFNNRVFLSSAWNGALEIHQKTKDGELVNTVPDLREFKPENYSLETFTVDGETLIAMNPGDYLVYIPSTSVNAMEVPIEPFKATTPGIIMYVAIGEDIGSSELSIEYTFHRLLTSEPLFWVSLIMLMIWLIALIIFAITSAQIRKYNERHERDNKIINESIETFTGFIDAKDPYTNGHSKRVAIYTKMIAKEMGYSGEELDYIYYIALLHDCGKIGVPDSVLGKPGKLTDEEFAIMKSHTVHGGEILSSFKSLKNAGEGALYHHERYDGGGYPEGRAGEDIPLIARMICVADSFDAMNTNRVYRKKLSREHIISEIENNKGFQFDPKIADIMLGLLRDGKVPVEG
ncbi:MAG: HD domain-containing protein [Clostridia bacterium]|nr:HD domain-containing protein [Clostridia bacterium]